MGEHDAQRRAAWRFVRAVIRSQSAGVIGAAVSGLLWQVGAVAAPLMVKQAIDRGVLTHDHSALLAWLGALLFVGLLEMAAGAVRHLYAIRNRARSDARVRDAIFAHALRLGIGAGRPLAGDFRGRSARIVDRALDIARLDAVFMPTLEFLPLLGLLAVLWLGGRRVIAGDLSLGSFVAFNAYVAMLVWPLRVLGQRVTTLQKAVGASARISEVLEAEPKLREPRHPIELEQPVRGDVRLIGVQFGHEDGHPVLDSLDLHVPPGESLALVGPTGSGKSTIAGLLARLYDPESGAVLLDGHNVRDLRVSDVRQAVALVFEETFLFTDTVKENIRFARPDAGDDDIQRAAALAGAAEFIADLPDGYETVLGERGFSLSGGQRQRVAIARAILADPAVLVLGDATSAVDATKEHEIRAALTTVMKGRTTLVIAHRPATIALADRVAVLDGGRIVEEGTHGELLRASPRYRALLALEAVA